MRVHGPHVSRFTFYVLLPLLLFTFGKGVLWASLVAPLDAPDEPSHVNYVVQVREGYWLPVVELVSPGGLRTPPSTPLNQDVRDWFARYDYKFFRSMPYESAQPPLYYWAAAIWSRPVPITPTSLPTLLLVVRIFSVMLGAGAVFALCLACRWAAPHLTSLAWAAPLALTLSPEFSFTTAAVSNDAGAIFWGAVLLAVWAFGLRTLESTISDKSKTMRVGEPPSSILHRPSSILHAALVAASGVVTAAGVLTKLTFVATVPATLLWIYWLSKRDGEKTTWRVRAGRWMLSSLVFAVATALLVLPWVARNIRVYGEPTGARGIFNLIHRIYWERLGFPSEQWFSQFPPVEFVGRSFRSFWALFGWATVWLDDWVYWALAIFVATAGAGGLAVAWSRRRALAERPAGKVAILALITCLVAFANYVGYNSLVEFQPHMRYTFTALAPAMLLLAAGLAAGPWTPRVRQVLLVTFLAALAAVHVMSLAALWAHTQQVLAVVNQ
jgi:hypothetical protein